MPLRYHSINSKEGESETKEKASGQKKSIGVKNEVDGVGFSDNEHAEDHHRPSG